MKINKLTIAAIFLSVSTGIAATPACRVATVTAAKKVYSEATKLKWKHWGEKHPEWVKAHPNGTGRKTIEETLHQFDYACAAIPTIETEVTDLIADEPRVDLSLLTDEVGLPWIPAVPPTSTTPEQTWPALPVYVPIPIGGAPLTGLSPVTTSVPPSVPEPGTWVLMATGLVVASTRKRG